MLSSISNSSLTVILSSLYFSSVCCSGQFTWITSPPSAADRHWFQCAAWGCRAERLRGQGERSQTTELEKVVGLKGFRRGDWGYEKNQVLSDRQESRGQWWWHRMESWGGRRGVWLSTNRRWKVSHSGCVCVCVHVYAFYCTSVCGCSLTCMHECI